MAQISVKRTLTNLGGDQLKRISNPLERNALEPLRAPFASGEAKQSSSLPGADEWKNVESWHIALGGASATTMAGQLDPNGGEVLVTDDDRQATITQLGDGGFVVVWASFSVDGVFGQRFDANGVAVGGEFVIASDSETSYLHANVTPLSDRGFLVAWDQRDRNGGNGDIEELRARLYGPDGQPVADDFIVTPLDDVGGNEGIRSIDGFADGGFVISWESGEDRVFAKIYDPQGEAGSRFVIDPDSRNSYEGQAAALDGGGLAVIIRLDSFQAAVSRFDSAGERLGPNIPLDGFQGVLSIAALDGGGFVVVGGEFTAAGEENGPSKVVAQRFGADGQPIGSEIRVSEAPFQFVRPSVEGLSDGGFIVTWTATTYTDDDVIEDVFARAYDQFGQPVGPEIRVNQTVEGNQNFGFGNSQVAAELADGQLVFVWSGEGAADLDGGVFLRLFDLDEAIVGTDGDDVVVGQTGDDTLRGLAGDDTLGGGRGADSLDGGGGRDWADYSKAAAKVRADLKAPGSNIGEATGDSYVSVENLRGSAFNDALFGNDVANRIEGLGKNDLLSGRDGNDTLAGGSGRDKLKGGEGNDRFELASRDADDADRILDFASGEDRIALDGDVFGLTRVKPGQFVVGSAAGDANDRLIYDAAIGKLFFDADGTGAGAKVLIATFSGAPPLAASDFVVI